MKRKVNLIVDVGNTTTVYGLFDGEEFLDKLIIPTHSKISATLIKQVKKFMNQHTDLEVTGGMIFSVVPNINKKVIKVSKLGFNFIPKVFDWENYDYKNKTDKIQDKIGADLIADLVGLEKYYGHPAVVADLGTISKTLYVDEEGNFTGASFIPGMEVQMNSISNNTALLPKISLSDEIKKEAPVSTIGCIKHGVYWSNVSFIDFCRNSYADSLKMNVKLVITGGNSIFVKDALNDCVYDPLLTLKGMNLLFLEK